MHSQLAFEGKQDHSTNPKRSTRFVDASPSQENLQTAAEYSALKREHGGCEDRIADLQAALKSKEAEFAGVVAEGTALSKTKAQRDTTIKELRGDIKELESKVWWVQSRSGRRVRAH